MSENLSQGSKFRETNNNEFKSKIEEFLNNISSSEINEENLESFYQYLLKNHNNKKDLIEFLKLCNFFILKGNFKSDNNPFNKNQVKEKIQSILDEILKKNPGEEDFRLILEFSNYIFIDCFQDFFREVVNNLLANNDKEDIKLIIRTINLPDLIKLTLEKLFNLKEDLNIQDYIFIVINIRCFDDDIKSLLEYKFNFFIERENFDHQLIGSFIKELINNLYQPYNSKKRKEFYKNLIVKLLEKIGKTEENNIKIDN